MQLRLLSLNVWGLAWPVSRIPEERMRRIAGELPGLELDAVAFQEAWSAPVRAALLEGGRQAGLSHSWYRDQPSANGGILILSRWPIREAHFTPFDLGGLPQRVQHADFYGGKGFAQCVLETPHGPLELFATHLHAGYGRVGDADEYFGHRAAQAIELALAVATSTRPLAVLGDLNAGPDRDEMRILVGATGLTDTAAVAGNPAPTYRSSSPGDTKRIDYILTRSGTCRGVHVLTSRRALDGSFHFEGREEPFSDHMGVLTDIALAGPGRPLPTPTADSLDLGRRALRRGERIARKRQGEQRAAAMSAGLLAIGSGLAARATRRQWLRRAAAAGAALATLPAISWAALAEGFTPTELAGFRRVEAKLDQLTQLARERTQRQPAPPAC